MVSMTPRAMAVDGCEIVNERIFAFLFKISSEERRSRACKFLKKVDAYRCLIAESLLKYCFLDAGIDNSIKICVDPNNGKPCLRNSSHQFNISHSGDWVVCAIDHKEIGIDIEKIHEVDRNLAVRFFSSAENEMLSHCRNKEEYLNLFFEMWVLKESYIKAIGKGLSCKLDSFSTLSFNSAIELVMHDATLPEKRFKLYSISKEYKCAICHSSDKSPDHIDVVPIDEIINSFEKVDSKIFARNVFT
jgi:4'-phosphopantetheinyl transferase